MMGAEWEHDLAKFSNSQRKRGVWGAQCAPQTPLFPETCQVVWDDAFVAGEG